VFVPPPSSFSRPPDSQLSKTIQQDTHANTIGDCQMDA
jgi:hypothetical protein